MLSLANIKNALTGSKVNEKVVQGDFWKVTLYNQVIENSQTIGGKQFANIPLSLLEIDEDYQRLYCINMSKIEDLVRHFDKNKCEPILVVPHPETHTFAVINGSHRMMATELRGYNSICSVLAEGLPEEPHERKIKEAELFCDQNVNVDHMSPAHKHKANVTRNIKKYTVLDECIKGRRLLLSIHELKNLEKAKQDALIAEGYRVLSGYSVALQTAALTNGKEILTSVFDIIEESGWHKSSGAYGANVIKSVSSVLNLHDNAKEIKQAIINIFTPIEPEIYFAKACAMYPSRKESERLVIYLETEVAKLIGEEPLYTGGDLRKLTVLLNRKRYDEKINKENKEKGNEAI